MKRVHSVWIFSLTIIFKPTSLPFWQDCTLPKIIAHFSLCRGLFSYVSLWKNQRDNVRVNVVGSSSPKSEHNATFNSYTEKGEGKALDLN